MRHHCSFDVWTLTRKCFAISICRSSASCLFHLCLVTRTEVRSVDSTRGMRWFERKMKKEQMRISVLHLLRTREEKVKTCVMPKRERRTRRRRSRRRRTTQTERYTKEVTSSFLLRSSLFFSLARSLARSLFSRRFPSSDTGVWRHFDLNNRKATTPSGCRKFERFRPGIVLCFSSFSTATTSRLMWREHRLWKKAKNRGEKATTTRNIYLFMFERARACAIFYSAIVICSNVDGWCRLLLIRLQSDYEIFRFSL